MTSVATTGCLDFVQFFRSWIADPLRVSAIAPSGEALARLITRDIAPDDGPVLELGPGTGVFTKALLARGVSERDLTLVEYGSEFMRMLQFRFPQARVLWMDAAQLARYELFAGAPVGIGGQRIAATLDVAAQGDVDSFRHLQLHAAGRRLLSIHLWAALSGAASDPRPSRSQGHLGRTCRPQHSSGRGLQDRPAPASDDRQSPLRQRDMIRLHTSSCDHCPGLLSMLSPHRQHVCNRQI